MLDEGHYATISAPDGPVLYNALHFIQDPEELAVRNNDRRAAFTLRRFVASLLPMPRLPDSES